tara:strand:+ start:7588 stop:8493 length:906 start_codon:yes stop_codon:yes gene_type:complete
MSFASLKKSSYTDLLSKAESLNKTEVRGADERLWKPEVDKAGNGYAVIRFLPAPDGEDLPWAQVWSHAFQGPGGWYIENSLTTLGKKDPVSELNRTLWNSGQDSDKEIARKQKRKLSYYSNIYVVQDPANPQNEGRVFLYKFGKKIFDKLTEAMQPAFADETPINPFDFWKGADFKVKIRKVEGYWNYDKSEFAEPSTLKGFDDAELETLWSQQYSLTDFTAPDKFKTFEELETRLQTVLSTQPTRRIPDAELEDESEGKYREVKGATEIAASAAPSFKSASAPATEEDDALSYFAKLANE